MPPRRSVGVGRGIGRDSQSAGTASKRRFEPISSSEEKYHVSNISRKGQTTRTPVYLCELQHSTDELWLEKEQILPAQLLSDFFRLNPNMEVEEVEAIAGKKVFRGVAEYEVRWVGYKDSTFEPFRSIAGCTDAIKKFESIK